MKKIIISLFALMACMSISAQVVKVYDTQSDSEEPEATYTNSTNHSYKVVFEEVKNFYNNNHEYVDLGLTSGTLWATCNVGGNHPEDYGYYFAWASTDGYTMGDGHDFSVATAPYSSLDEDESTYAYSKYNSTTTTTLESADDAACLMWASSWRIPTRDDWTELRNECTWKYYMLNGDWVWKISSNTNDNYILLPCAGFIDGTSRSSVAGYYWTSENLLSTTKKEYAYAIIADVASGEPYEAERYRYYGYSIRPVFKRETPTFKFSIIKTTLSVNQVSMASNLKVISRSDGEVTYTSSDESIACVDASTGSVMGKSKGTATITASVAETMSYYAASASYTVVVNPTDPTLTFPLDSKSVNIGDTFTQTVETNSDGAVTYSSSNTSVATVDPKTGEVTGVAAGTATITASVAASNKYNAATATYTVTVANTSSTCSMGDFDEGETVRVSLQSTSYHIFYVNSASSGSYSFKTSDASVASIAWYGSSFGINSYYIKAAGRGTAKITLTVAADDDHEESSTYIYVEVYDDNLLSGKFSVSASKQVLFTKSNIYWDGSDNALKFESRQISGYCYWDSKHVSHFYWTKTAQKSYAENYDDGSNTINDVPFFAESNGGLTVEGTSGLYVLSYDEWRYLLYSRPNASKLCLKDITVTYSKNSFDNCTILAPDDYSGPALVTITDWSLENVNELGLVCLPAKGSRDGSSYELTENGYYWTSTPYENNAGSALLVWNGKTAGGLASRCYGKSIRLVANP